MSENPRRVSRIPDFKSREEEAEFWDTHDVTEFWDELEPSKLEVSREFRDRIAARAAANPVPDWPVHVHVDLADRPLVEELAHRIGLTPTTVIQL